MLAAGSAAAGPPAMMMIAETITAREPRASPPRCTTSTRVAAVRRSAPWTISAEPLLTRNPIVAMSSTAGASTSDGASRRLMLSTNTTADAAIRSTALASAPIVSMR